MLNIYDDNIQNITYNGKELKLYEDYLITSIEERENDVLLELEFHENKERLTVLVNKI